MAKVINRDVPIAEENTTLTGQPATNMYDDWSEEMEDRADNVYAVSYTHLTLPTIRLV